MKDKMLYLVLGILIGAVITAGCFLIVSKTTGNQMGGGQRPEMGDMENFKMDGNSVPPDGANGGMEKPDQKQDSNSTALDT